jgi:hypothetical protein
MLRDNHDDMLAGLDFLGDGSFDIDEPKRVPSKRPIPPKRKRDPLDALGDAGSYKDVINEEDL